MMSDPPVIPQPYGLGVGLGWSGPRRRGRDDTMATSSTPPGRLTDAQLVELIELTKGADSVELKLTAPDSARGATMTALGMDPLEAQIRQVYFFDTPDLRLNHDGLVVRARRVQGRGDDSVVKL